MSTMACDDVGELFDELALDTLPGDVRALVLEHLAGCTSCRTTVEQLSATADALLLVLPSVEPPPGFELRVRNTIRERPWWRRPSAASSPAAAPTAPAASAGGTGRRWSRALALVAAAAAAVTLVSRGVRLAEPGSRRGASPTTPVLAGEDHELATAKLIAVDGRTFGDVSIYAGSPAWFFMRVDRAQITTTYRCVLDLVGGQTISLGDLAVANGKGAWGRHVGLGGHRVQDARVIDASGRTVATATFA